MNTITITLDINHPKLGELIALIGDGEVKTNAKTRKKKPVEDEELDLEEDTDELDIEEEPEEEGITEQMLMEQAKKILKAKKKPFLEKVLAKYKVPNISALKPAKYEAFHTDLLKAKV